MSDFWNRILQEPGRTETAPASPPAPQAWWQRSLPQAQQAPAAEQAPVQTAQQPQQEAQGSQERTQWARQSDQSCPSCQSGNYWAHPEQPQARPRCYDCGYPLMQSGSGPSLKGQAGGEVKAARQTSAASTSNYSPQHIFHHMA